MRIAISVGHGKKDTRQDGIINDPGAVNEEVGINEFDTSLKQYWVLLGLLQEDVELSAINIHYNIPLKYRVNQINELHRQNPIDLAIELHLNANVNPNPNYTEAYYYADDAGHYSKKGKLYGDIMVPVMSDELGIIDGKRDRAAEAFGDEEWEGHRNYFVRVTNCPALIVEPWFISNVAAATEAKEGGLITKAAVAVYKGLRAVYEKEFK